MGLDCSHGAFNGAYSAFNTLRKYVARCSGGSFPPHSDADMRRIPGLKPDWFHYDEEFVPKEHVAGCEMFLSHSDCEGELSYEECGQVARFLEWVAERGDYEPSFGHLARYGPRMRDAVVNFAKGCRKAALDGESLEFR